MSIPTKPTSTSLLPPDSAVSMVWARTGKFSSEKPTKPGEKPSKVYTTLTESTLKELMTRARNDSEKRYVARTVSAMDSSLRTLNTVWKGRELNFDENEKLRLAYLDSARERARFGNTMKDFLKALPTVTVSSAGSVAAFDYVGVSGILLLAIGLIVAGISYLAHVGWMRSKRKERERQYVTHDYERDLYYAEYVNKVKRVLISLYDRVQEIHKNVFGREFSQKKGEVVVKEILEGVRSRLCEYIHDHIGTRLHLRPVIDYFKKRKYRKIRNRIAADLWVICESGDPVLTKKCQYWGEKDIVKARKRRTL